MIVPMAFELSHSHSHPHINGVGSKRIGSESQWVSAGRRGARDLRKKRFQMPDSPPHFRSTPVDQTVSPGSLVSLSCSAVGFPAPVITWTRDGEPLVSTLRINVGSFRVKMSDVVVSFVNMSSVTGRDGGLFRCSAHNSAGMATHAARLNVYGPPFIRSMRNFSVVAGNDVTIWCPAGGFPSPFISWTFSGHPLPQSLRQVVLSNNTLIIRNAKERDTGRYTCIATDRKGQEARENTFLHIINPPIIEPFSFALGLREGRRAQLTCMVTSGDLPIRIHWLKNGYPLLHDPNIEQKQISDYSMVLLFKRLDEHHSGSYTCVATNSASSSNHTDELNVKVPPEWIISPSELSVSVGSAVKLECVAKGVPPPVVSWSKSVDDKGREFESLREKSLRVRISGNGTLFIADVVKRDGARYMCEASNGVGSPLSKVVKMIVTAQPKIRSSGGRVTGHAGKNIQMTCEVKGDPPLKIAWLRGHQAISNTGRSSISHFDPNNDSVRSVLSLEDLLQSDAGTYECHATNQHGSHSKIFNLLILESPSAPRGIEIARVSSRSARITWSKSNSAVVTIQLAEVAEGTWSERGRNVTVDGDVSSSDILSLHPFTKYRIRVFSSNELGVSPPSQEVHFTTLEEAPDTTPRNIRVTSHQPGSLRVSWVPPSQSRMNGRIRGYVIAIRKQNIREEFTFITRPTSPEGEGEEYVVQDLSPNTLYEVSLKVFNRMGVGPLSSPRIVQETMFDAPACAPSGVSCKGDGLAGIRVWWESLQSTCAHSHITGYSILVTQTHYKSTHSSSSLTQEVTTTNLEKNLAQVLPASNISIVLRGHNTAGFSPPSMPVFCHSLDDVPPSPRDLRVVPSVSGTVVAVWLPPTSDQGLILRYTLYYEYENKVRHISVPNSDVDSSWKKLSGFQKDDYLTVWVTASTSAGEGGPSPHKRVTLSPTAIYGPFVVASRTLWVTGMNSAVTLRCSSVGEPRPSLSWLRHGALVTNDHRHHLLPGGHLHIIPESSVNYTCRAESSVGKDDLQHSIVVLSPPSKPFLTVIETTRSSLNVSLSCHDDGGAPILGYKIYQKYKNGQWLERSASVSTTKGTSSSTLRDLPCGSVLHLYAIAWNSQGDSTPSETLVTSTRGSAPARPQPSSLVEVNSTCITLRLYSWPEKECPIHYWRVEGKQETANEWRVIFARVGREARDQSFCDIQRTEAYILRILAYSEAGRTIVTYKVLLQDIFEGHATSAHVKEILLGSEAFTVSSLDAHFIAGTVSAILLSAAAIICTCVTVRKKYLDRKQFSKSSDAEGNPRSSHPENDMVDNQVYSPLSLKKMTLMSNTSGGLKRKYSRSSLISSKCLGEMLVAEDLNNPHATFSNSRRMDETIHYGISLHTHSPSSRECYEGVQKHSEDINQTHKDRPLSIYRESDVSYAPVRSRSSFERTGKQRSKSGLTPKERLQTKEDETFMSERSAHLQRDQRPPVIRMPSAIPLLPESARSNLSSPVHRNYSPGIPIQTLYHVKGNAIGNVDNTAIISSQHVR